MLAEYNRPDLTACQLMRYARSKGLDVKIKRERRWLGLDCVDYLGCFGLDGWVLPHVAIKYIAKQLGKTTGQIYDEIVGKESQLEKLKKRIEKEKQTVNSWDNLDPDEQDNADGVSTGFAEVLGWIDEIMKGE